MRKSSGEEGDLLPQNRDSRAEWKGLTEAESQGREKRGWDLGKKSWISNCQHKRSNDLGSWREGHEGRWQEKYQQDKI